MSKITAFIFELSKGGAQGVFVTLMNYFHRKGYDIEVVVQNLNDPIHKDNLDESIKVTSLNANSAKDSLKALINYIGQNSIEYAWVFGPEMAVNLYLAKKINRKNFPIYARSINTLSTEFKYTKSFFRKYVTHTLIKLFYHKVNYVVAQSEGMRQDLVKNYGFKEYQVYMINNALNEKFEAELEYNDSVSKENMILYAGRIEQQKGLEMLVEAFSKMNDKSVILTLVGDGSLRNELKKKVDTLGISDRVSFVSYTNQIEKYYKRAKVTAMSSYFEGFPNVLVESIACGTPIVAYDLPSGPKEIIIQDVNGILVDYLNVDALAKALDKALIKEWDYVAIKKTAERYKQDIILKQYLELFAKA